jgi:hypothetical protein
MGTGAAVGRGQRAGRMQTRGNGWPRTRKGVANQIGTTAWNSLSRMPGSWSGIANPHRIRGWHGSPLSPKSEFTRDRKSELDFNALIRGPAAIGAAHKGWTYDCARPSCKNAHKNSCQPGRLTALPQPSMKRRRSDGGRSFIGATKPWTIWHGCSIRTSKVGSTTTALTTDQ